MGLGSKYCSLQIASEAPLQSQIFVYAKPAQCVYGRRRAGLLSGRAVQTYDSPDWDLRPSLTQTPFWLKSRRIADRTFAEAREEIEMAMESKETVYFDEEAECAKAVVKEVVDLFDGLLAKLPESERAALQRSMGLKIEQLKAELKQLDD
ncbi:hypothetical protein CRG98_017180 [Punica granatum]|uniref:Uncharacterized protein n=1 Tax=Punica granatum TaxID=22663 RepID=A0A2I0K1E5_PUNGR|nr:hypothetical protein CRG98_017180 [Punica granatum]